MSASQKLPMELVLKVLGYMEDDFLTIVNFSNTCKAYRRHLAPTIFEHLIFSHDRKSSGSALAAAQRYPQHVMSLTFVGHPETSIQHSESSSRSDQDQRHPDDVLPPEARTLLSGRYTPNARILHLKYEFDYPEEEHSLLAAGHDEKVNTDPYTGWTWDRTNRLLRSTSLYQISEAFAIWEERMTAVWYVLIKNQILRELYIGDMVANSSDVFADIRWGALIGRLEKLSIALASDEVKPFTSTFHDFVHDIERHIYWQVNALESFELKGSKYVLEGNESFPILALVSAEMPVLRHLRLDNVCLEEGLKTFLVSHAKVLKTIRLCNVWGYFPDSHYILWQNLFDAYVAADPVVTDVRVYPDGFRYFKPCLIRAASPPESMEYWLECHERSKKTQDTFAGFPYGHFDPLAHVVRVKQFSARGFIHWYREGADLRAYRRLKVIAFVNQHREAGAPLPNLRVNVQT